MGFVLLVALSLKSFPTFKSNLYALDVLQAATKSPEPRFFFDAPSGLRRLVGALLLSKGAVAESRRILEDYTNTVALEDKLAWFLLAKARSQLGDPIQAGYAYEKSGVLLEVEQHKAVVKTIVGAAEVAQLESAILALANEAALHGDLIRASKYTQLVRGLSGDNFVGAESYRIEATMALSVGEFYAAALAARQSLDILPPADNFDPRLKLLLEAADKIIQADQCQVTQDNLVFSLLVVYSPIFLPSISQCADQFIESILDYLPAEEHPFLLIRKAAALFNQGQPERSFEFLQQAQSLDLPLAWSIDMFPQRSSTGQPIVLHPTYPVNQEGLIGYEVDPLQVELGLPLDMILFYQKGKAPLKKILAIQNADLLFYQTVNLSPDPGFEYAMLQRKTQAHEVLPAYARDIYGASSNAQQIVWADRPAVPGRDSKTVRSSVLTLTNQHNPFYKSGVASFDRLILPNQMYLQGGWIKSENGSGYIGRYWYGTARVPPYDYAIDNYRSANWLYVSQVVQSPADAYALDLWLLNFETPGDASFDNLVFIALP